jgi:hypothetical protein
MARMFRVRESNAIDGGANALQRLLSCGHVADVRCHDLGSFAKGGLQPAPAAPDDTMGEVTPAELGGGRVADGPGGPDDGDRRDG